MFSKLFGFCNQYTGKSWWFAVEIGGFLLMVLALVIAAPCLDMCWDTRHSFGAGAIIGDVFNPQNPLRVVIYGRWVVSDQNSHWVLIVAMFALTFGGRIGELMIMMGDHYRRGFVYQELPRRHWLLRFGAWVKAN